MNNLFALASTSVLSLPTTFDEAQTSCKWTQWEAAIQEEMDKMEKYKVYDIVQDEGQRAINAKFVFTHKIDGTTGKIIKHKARLVAEVFKQRAGYDYAELFASVAHKDTLRIFFAIVNYFDLHYIKRT
jgi:hypothetical protein